VLTVSDSRTPETDKSGDTLVDRLDRRPGMCWPVAGIVPDDRPAIVARLRKAGSPTRTVDVILTTGGTGLTGRDVTVEAHREVYEKEIEAFGTVFTIVSMQKIGTSAVQSRATGGVAGGTYLFRPARQPRRLPRCLGRDPETPVRQPPPALQLRRDHAAAGGTSAAEVTDASSFGFVSSSPGGVETSDEVSDELCLSACPPPGLCDRGGNRTRGRPWPSAPAIFWGSNSSARWRSPPSLTLPTAMST
jgi:molybdenum cofactor synthesis domain-containing protein